MNTSRVAILWPTGTMGGFLHDTLSNMSSISLVDVPKIDFKEYSLVQIERHFEPYINDTIFLDFSHRIVTESFLKISQYRPIKIFCGTSDVSPQSIEDSKIHSHGRFIHRANYSRSYKLVKEFIERVKSNGQDWDFNLLDIHGNHKVDSPSATAREVYQHWYKNADFNENKIASLRIGSGISQHKITLDSGSEVINVSFEINNRDAFTKEILSSIRELSDYGEKIHD
jgi:dihydrodipicolinate reductase